MTREEAVLVAANSAGLSVRAVDGRLVVSPADRVNDAMRQLLGEFKAGVLALVVEADHLTEPLLDAAMTACDHHQDGEEARQLMRTECLLTPAHLRAGLLHHLRATYAVPSLEGTVIDWAHCSAEGTPATG